MRVVIQPVKKKKKVNRRKAVLVVTNLGTVNVPSVRVMLVGLNKKIKLQGASGTVNGQPFVMVGSLPVGATITVPLSFKNKKNLALRFSTQAQAG